MKLATQLISLLIIGLCNLGLNNLHAHNSENTDHSQAISSNNNQAIIIDYEVHDGDTLSSLTEKYLGDSSLWRINADLNPQLANINELEPGTTIRLISAYQQSKEEVEAAQAIVEIISNKVNKSLQRGEWQNVSGGDELKPKDGIRTQENSSAVLVFDNISRVQMTEFSQVFLRERETQENGLTRNEIEIEKGEAQLNISNKDAKSGKPENEFEILTGTVRTKPQTDAAGQQSTKARLNDDDSSQIMVYAGNSKVESAGVSVDVETGMGTIAKSGEAPTVPEKLLLAPDISKNSARHATPDNALIGWGPLSGATHYSISVCDDAECNNVVQHHKNILSTQMALSQLPEGLVYWKVSAVSKSGLDGFPSELQSIEIKLPEAIPQPKPRPKGIPWFIWFGISAYLVYFLWAFLWHANK